MTYDEIQKYIKEDAYSGPNGRDFYEDLMKLSGVPDNELTARMYSLAWQNGHSYGYQEVLHHFRDLIWVFKNE